MPPLIRGGIFCLPELEIPAKQRFLDILELDIDNSGL